MKKIKSLVFLMLFTFLISSLFICSASEKNNIDWESLSQRTQLPVEDLQEAYSETDHDTFMKTIEGIENSLNYNPEYENDAISTRMSANSFAGIVNATRKGSIWITKDSGQTIYEHGHAAIVVSVENIGANKNVVTIEHRGKKAGATYSARYGSLYNTFWSARNTMRTYDVSNYSNATSGNTTKMNAAATYASQNLTGKIYYLLAGKTEDRVNCATLVYKAYNSQGIKLENPLNSTVIPKDIVNDSNTILKAQYGWLGHAHRW